MSQNLKPGTRLALDPIGLLYAGTSCKEFPNNYTISVYLNEKINPEILQLAVTDIFKRLPILNGKLVETETDFYYEILKETPLISRDNGLYPYEQYYLDGSRHALRVVYGEAHFKVEAMHFITDGRSTMEVAKGIAIRYYELLGVNVEKGYGIDATDEITSEEFENAFENFSTLTEKQTTEANKEQEFIKAYRHEGSKPETPHVTTLHFDLGPLKAAAKSYNATINTYIQAQLMAAIAMERDARKCDGRIHFNFAADCRPYFGSRTFRNFATGGEFYLNETLPLDGIIATLKNQAKLLNKDFFQATINQMQKMLKQSAGLPIAKQKEIVHLAHKSNTSGTTAIFSNIGLVKFPPSISDKIKNMEFSISQDGNPYTFSVITVGSVMTMTITSSIVGNTLENEIKHRLENPTFNL